MANLEMDQDDRLIFNANLAGGPQTYLSQQALENLFELGLDGTRVGHVQMDGSEASQDRAVLLRARGADDTIYAMPLDKTGEAIQRAVDSLPNEVSNGLVFLPAGNYSLTSGIVVEKHHVTVQGHGVKLVVDYENDDEPAFWARPPAEQKALLGFSLHGNIAIHGPEPEPDPHPGTGWLFENLMAAVLEGFSVHNLRYGIRLLGNGGGCAYNRLMLREVRHCVVGLTLDAADQGYVNQNTFVGGRFLNSGAMANDDEAAHLVIHNHPDVNDPNGNLFLHQGIECAAAEDAIPAVVCSGVANTFIDLRNENVDGLVFTSSSARNLVLGGRGIRLDHIVDDGQGNAVYLVEDFGSHERVIASSVVLSGAMKKGANPTRGLQRVVAIQAGQDLPTGPPVDPALADRGNTGMLCVTGNGDLIYVSPDGRKTRLAGG